MLRPYVRRKGKPRSKCEGCGFNPVKQKGRYKDGSKMWDKICWGCNKNKNRKLLTMACSICGFKPTHTIQLDIDHIDGNKMNKDITNLQVLCANCHRLKTWENKDYIRKYK